MGRRAGSTGCGPSSARSPRSAPILIKAETDLVGVARHQGGLPPVKEAASEPRSSGMALARKAAAALKFHRLVLGIEASLLILLLAVLDTVRGDLFFTRLGVAVLAGIARPPDAAAPGVHPRLQQAEVRVTHADH